jgi:putative peptidoglycan lipid II flippase
MLKKEKSSMEKSRRRKKSSDVVRSTGIVAASTLASRILGFIRDMLMAAVFGASGATDAFFVAFRIPNMLRRFVAEGTLTISFIPVYTEVLLHRGENEAGDVASRVLTLQMLVIAFLISLGIFFSPEIIGVIGYGFRGSEFFGLAVSLNRVMFPYLFFIGFVAFSMGILNSHGYFFAPAFSPVLLNVGMISGILVFSLFFEEPLYGVSAGVIMGGIFQFILQVPYLIKSGFRLSVSFNFNHPQLKKIYRLLAPAFFANGIVQINILIGTVMASTLESGSISYLYYADRLTEIVLGVFIISIGNVILPEMSRLTASNNMEKFRDIYTRSLKSALYLAVPASIALMVIGFPVISVLFMRGEFSSREAELTAKALFYASIGISSISVNRITVPAFFSLKEAKKPAASAAAALLVYIVSGYFLMQTSLKHAGLALAGSLSATMQMVILLVLLNRLTGGIRLLPVLSSFIKFILSGVAMAYVVRSIAITADWTGGPLPVKGGILFLMVAGGGITYFVVSLLLKSEEAFYLYNRLRGKKR